MRRRPFVVIGTIAGLALAASSRAQSVTITSATTVSVPPPKEANYTSGTSDVTQTGQQITFKLDCPANANGGCSLKIGFTGTTATLTLKAQLSGVSKVGGNNNDVCSQVGLTAFTTLNPASSSTAIVTATKGASCTGILNFEVTGLTYTAFTSPNTYTQNVTLTATNP